MERRRTTINQRKTSLRSTTKPRQSRKNIMKQATMKQATMKKATMKKKMTSMPKISPYIPINNFDTLDDYLTIFTELIGTDTIYKSLKGMSKNIILTETKETIPSNKNCIYYYDGIVTHYRVIKNNINIDPYDNYQKPNSHGFCQLFAYYIFIGETDNLKIARRTTALADYANNMIQVINNITHKFTQQTYNLINTELPYVCKEQKYPLITLLDLLKAIQSYKLEDFVNFVKES